MREIKFRVWDSQNKSMYGWENLTDSNWKLQELYKPAVGIIFMQFTGLKDKNGKEIYDGDIVTLCNFNYKKLTNEIDREKSIEMNLKKGVVEWMPNTCCFMVVERHLKCKIFDEWNNSLPLRPSKKDDYEIEVIGNIYENPDLLPK